MPRITQAQKDTFAEFHADHPTCWMCKFLDQKPLPTELHHIAGRGLWHHVRENYAALCQRHHSDIQSISDAELVCLALKWIYDRDNYDAKIICHLRGRAETCWTHSDVVQAVRVMSMIKECAK